MRTVRFINERGCGKHARQLFAAIIIIMNCEPRIKHVHRVVWYAGLVFARGAVLCCLDLGECNCVWQMLKFDLCIGWHIMRASLRVGVPLQLKRI